MCHTLRSSRCLHLLLYAHSSFDEDSGEVLLRMAGSCVGCPSSTVTLKSGIENMLKYYVPEVVTVNQIDPEDLPAVAGEAADAGIDDEGPDSLQARLDAAGVPRT